MEKIKPVGKTGNIGLFFGSFNPVTQGHLTIAEHAMELECQGEKLDEVWFIVSPHNPHKWKKGVLAEEGHRWEMAKLGVQSIGNPLIQASNIEFFLEEKPSYTHHTLLELQKDNPDAKLFIVCGTDTHHKIQIWKSSKWIHENCYFWVFPRGKGGHKPVKNETMQGRSFYLDTEFGTDASATQIRDLIKEDKSIEGLTPTEVVEYINENGVYDFVKP
jgi:nicotinate-nucleotide adenylyltransferase